MKTKLVVLIAAVAFLLGGCATVSAPSKANVKGNYKYTTEPKICFFPVTQAKWDGYKVTNKDWNKLTDYLKLMFIFESVKELERTNSVIITMKDSKRILSALNYGIDKINQEVPTAEIPVINFFYDVLQGAKMVTPRQPGVTRR